MPARNSDTERRRRSGPTKVPSRLKSQLGATRLTPCWVNQSTMRENNLDNAANATANKANPIQRHNGVPITCQLTSGSGRFLSIGELSAIWAIVGILATLSEETTQTERPEC